VAVVARVAMTVVLAVMIVARAATIAVLEVRATRQE